MSFGSWSSHTGFVSPHTAAILPVVVGPSIDEATLTLVRTIMESTIQPHPSQALALNAFTTAFQRWNPQKMSDIKPIDQATLDLLFTIPPTPLRNFTTNSFGNGNPAAAPHYDQVFQTTLQGHRQAIGTLVQSFNQSLGNGTLTIEELRSACTALESSIWHSYVAYCNHLQSATTTTSTTTPISSPPAVFGFSNQFKPSPRPFAVAPTTPFFGNNIAVQSFPSNRSSQPLPMLPSIIALTSEIDKLENLKRTIQQYTSVCIQGKLYSLGDYTFQNQTYNGLFGPPTAFGTSGIHNTGTTAFDVAEKNCTSALQQQLSSIQGTIGTNPDFLYWYVYFKHNRSILLPSVAVKLPVVGTPGPLFDLDVSCQRIKYAFGPAMTYEGVGAALQLLSNENDYHAEIKVLLNCKILKLSAVDVTNFRAVKLLHEISKPLQDFIQSCVLHQFKVVERDPSFSELQKMVNDFYSEISHDRQSCLDFLTQLYSILCTTDGTAAGPYLTLLHNMYTLKNALPVDGLKPLKYVLHNSELRKFFLEMKWLVVDDENNTGEGLQKFHQDHETLLNILRNYDAMDELVIVKSLEPVVRLFFYLERYYNCQHVRELVTSLNNDHDIQTLLKGTTTIQNDIHDLSGRIHSLQDLFQNVCHPPTPPTVTSTSSLQVNIGTSPAPDVVSSNSDSTK